MLFRSQAFGAGFLAVDRERDANAMESALRFFPLLRNAGWRRPGEPAGKGFVMRTRTAVRKLHFVVWGAGHENILTKGSTSDHNAANPGPFGKSLIC